MSSYLKHKGAILLLLSLLTYQLDSVSISRIYIKINP